MSRYLTAGKIGILTVVAMYCDGYVPKGATIAILSFITSRLTPHIAEADGVNSKSGTSDPLALHDFESVLKPFQKARNAANLWDEFVMVSWRIRNLDELFTFFRSLPRLFSPRQDIDKLPAEACSQQTGLARTSMIGVFVRRAMVEFDKLGFQDTVLLWQSFETFRKPTTTSHPFLAQVAADLDPTWNFLKADKDSGGRISSILSKSGEEAFSLKPSVSSDDVEKLLGFQIDKIQSPCHSLMGPPGH